MFPNFTQNKHSFSILWLSFSKAFREKVLLYKGNNSEQISVKANTSSADFPTLSISPMQR